VVVSEVLRVLQVVVLILLVLMVDLEVEDPLVLVEQEVVILLKQIQIKVLTEIIQKIQHHHLVILALEQVAAQP
tara:strand:- start:153 stop:374 length:222 start_codon:yes stop_codon:yes gene_type:complete